MELYYLIIAGFVLRICYYLGDKNKNLNIKSYEGIANIKMIFFSSLLATLAVYLCSFAKFDDNPDTDSKFYMIACMYIALGWAIDNVFLNVITIYEQHIKDFIKKFSKK
jgi:hypothetical protein